MLRFLLVITLGTWLTASPSKAQDKTAPATPESPFEETKAKAEKGDAEAQFKLGVAYDIGKGVPKDEAEAVKWYRKAADQGNVGGQFGLGMAYANGQGVAKDEAESVKWFRKAAEQGNASAQLNLGAAYANGQGVPKDDVVAYKWILLAGATDQDARNVIPIIEERLTPEQRAEGQKMAREFKPVVEEP